MSSQPKSDHAYDKAYYDSLLYGVKYTDKTSFFKMNKKQGAFLHARSRWRGEEETGSSLPSLHHSIGQAASDENVRDLINLIVSKFEEEEDFGTEALRFFDPASELAFTVCMEAKNDEIWKSYSEITMNRIWRLMQEEKSGGSQLLKLADSQLQAARATLKKKGIVIKDETLYSTKVRPGEEFSPKASSDTCEIPPKSKITTCGVRRIRPHQSGSGTAADNSALQFTGGADMSGFRKVDLNTAQGLSAVVRAVFQDCRLPLSELEHTKYSKNPKSMTSRGHDQLATTFNSTEATE